MAEVGRNLWRSPGPILVLKQDNLQPAHQDHKDGDATTSPVPVLGHPHHDKKFFLVFRLDVLGFRCNQSEKSPVSAFHK